MTTHRPITIPAAFAALTLLLGGLGAGALTSVVSAAGTTLYVASHGSDSGNNCQTPWHPCATISYAVTQSVPVAYSGSPYTSTIDVGPGTFTFTAGVSPAPGGNLTIQGSHFLSFNLTKLIAPNFSADRSTLILNRLVINGEGGHPISSGYAGTLNLVDSTVTNSSIAVCSCGNGNLTVTDSTLSGSTIGAEAINTASVRITGSTLSRNDVAVETGIAGFVGLTDSTLSGNTAGVEVGSGAYGSVGLEASTVAGNVIGFEGQLTDLSTLTVAGTIVSNNSGKDCAFSSGALTDSGYNIDGDGTCGLTATTSQSNVNPDLWPLGYYGGPTQTMVPLWNSPAINKIPIGTSLCPGPTGTDQRGVSRPQGPKCDIGAVEVYDLW
jgi:hypothetical protein